MTISLFTEDGRLEAAFARSVYALVDAALGGEGGGGGGEPWLAEEVVRDVVLPDVHWAVRFPQLVRALIAGLLESLARGTNRIMRSVGGVARVHSQWWHG